MNEEKKPISSGEVLIELEKKHLELAEKQLRYSKLNCYFTAAMCALLLIIVVLIIKYVPTISDSLQHLENLDKLSEVEFEKLYDAIDTLARIVKSLPFVG